MLKADEGTRACMIVVHSIIESAGFALWNQLHFWDFLDRIKHNGNHDKTSLLFLDTDKPYPGDPRLSPKSDSGEWDKEQLLKRTCFISGAQIGANIILWVWMKTFRYAENRQRQGEWDCDWLHLPPDWNWITSLNISIHHLYCSNQQAACLPASNLQKFSRWQHEMGSCYLNLISWKGVRSSGWMCAWVYLSVVWHCCAW